MSLNIELLIMQLHYRTLNGIEYTNIYSAFKKQAYLPPTALLKLIAIEMNKIVSFLRNFTLKIAYDWY